jgi:hypothetical protein
MIQPCELQRHRPSMRRCSTPRAVRWPIAYNLAVTARTLHTAVQPRHRCRAARVETLRDEAERVCHCRRKVRCNAVPTRTRAYKQLVHVHMRTVCARKRHLHRRFRCDLRKQTNKQPRQPAASAHSLAAIWWSLHGRRDGCGCGCACLTARHCAAVAVVAALITALLGPALCATARGGTHARDSADGNTNVTRRTA